MLYSYTRLMKISETLMLISIPKILAHYLAKNLTEF
jgi:hypothetical protein